MSYAIIGLDRGTCSIKAVLLEKSFRGYEVKGVRMQPVPQDGSAPPTDEAIEAAVGALVQEFDPEAVGYVVAASGNDASTWVLQMPFSDPRRIEQTLPFELENYVPFDLEDMVMDYEIVRTVGEKARVVAGLMPRSQMTTTLHRLAELKVDPQALVLDSYALTYVPPGRESGERPLAVVDLGHTQTLVTVRVGQAPDFLRTLQVGGLQVTQALMSAFKVTYATAERMKVEQGPVPLSTEDIALRLGIQPGGENAEGASASAHELAGGAHPLAVRRSLPGVRPSEAGRMEALRHEPGPGGLLHDAPAHREASSSDSEPVGSHRGEAAPAPATRVSPRRTLEDADDIRRTDPSPSARRYDQAPQDWLFDAERRPPAPAQALREEDLEQDVPTRVRRAPENDPSDWDMLLDPAGDNRSATDERSSFDDSGTWDAALRASLEITEEPVSQALRQSVDETVELRIPKLPVSGAASGPVTELEQVSTPVQTPADALDPRLTLPSREEVQTVIWEAQTPIFKEIRNTLMAYEAAEKKDLGAVLLVGGGALTVGIEERLTEYLGVKVGLPTRLGPEQIQLAEDNQLVRFALPFALSYLGAADGRYGNLNFRQGAFSYRRNYEAVRGYLVAALVLLAVGLLALSTIFVKRVTELNREGDELDAKIAETMNEAFPEIKVDTTKGADKALAQILEEEQKLQDRGKVLGVGAGHRRTMDVLKEISTVAPAKEELTLDLDEFFIEGDQLKLRGTTGSFDDVEKIEKALQGDSMVKELKNDVSTKDGKKFFSITITLKGSDEDSPS